MRVMDAKNTEKLKKILIYTTFAVVFIALMWIIFSPKDSGDKDKNVLDSISSIPEPTTSDFFDDKMSVYDKFVTESQKDSADMQAQKSLDSMFSPGGTMMNDFSQPVAPSTSMVMNEIYDITENSARYREAEERAERLKSEKIELERRLARLEYERDEMTSLKDNFTPEAPAATDNNPIEGIRSTAQERDIASSFAPAKKKPIKIEVEQGENVSVLGGDMSSRANSFNSDLTAKKQEQSDGQNTIKAVVDHTITIKDGDIVPLRLKQSVRIDDIYYPKNTIVYGFANVSGTRLHISIKKLEINNSIHDTDLVVYDNDGQEGLYVPVLSKNSLASDISKGVGSSTQSAGTNISISGENNPVRQLQTDATRGVISGISNFIQNKLNEVKITLKGNYNVFIMSNKN